MGVDSTGGRMAATAVRMGASRPGDAASTMYCDDRGLAVPVLTILDFLGRLAPLMGPDQLITDVGSTKLQIFEMVKSLRANEVRVRMLPGHPMAGKESGGAGLGDAGLFEGAMWLFTPAEEEWDVEREWREWVGRFGARTMDMDARRHDQVCAWVSHLPQMVATAMAAMYEDELGAEPGIAAEFQAIGGRALREMTRLGASPNYSMWRDVAMSNTEPLAATLFALEQRLQHLREGLRTPEQQSCGRSFGWRMRFGLGEGTPLPPPNSAKSSFD